jgi:predicted porin
MKKSLVALAVLGAFAGIASAQSSVTLFGVLDVNARYVKNGDYNVKSMSTDGINSSRLGFRGVEDLGGGLKAGFWLEAGINPDTGTTNVNSQGVSTFNKFFNRRSTLSLMGGFGELRLGRDYVPAFNNLTTYDPFGTNGVGSYLNVFTGGALSLGAATTLVRADNAIGYFLPSGLGGFYGQGMVAAGEGAVAPTQAVNKHYGGRVGYAAGPFDVSFAYGQTMVPANVSVPSQQDFKISTVGGSWDFGMAKVTGQYAQMEYSTLKNKLYQFGLVVPLGAGEIHASYSANDGQGYLGNTGARTTANTSTTTFTGSYEPDNAKQYAIGYVYNLSKRTAVYGNYAQINNDGLQRSLVATNPPNSALPSTARDVKSTGFELGLRHSF